MKKAFIFPGQGSQAIGMMEKLAERYTEIKSTFKQASEVLGEDLWEIVSTGPEGRLNSTEITQPALLAAGYATWQIYKVNGGSDPAMMAGHSLGEYTALACAGAISFPDAIRLVNARGKYMQNAVAPGVGAMAAILGMDDTAVIDLCKDSAQGEVVAAVNFNSPGQVVIAGHSKAVERATEMAKERGAKKAVLLKVSAPSHCELMKPAAEQLASDLSEIEITAPSISVINNVDVKSANDPAAIRDALTRQLYQPVRWVETIRFMISEGVDRIVECGPGKVLFGLNKRIDKTVENAFIIDPESLQAQLD